MLIKEPVSLSGVVDVRIKNLLTGEVIPVSIPNLITDAGKDLLATCLGASATDAEIKYMGVGTDATAPSASDTALGTEVARVALDSYDDTGAAGVITHSFTIGTSVANGSTIEELGFFMGSAATATLDTGTLFSRVLLGTAKTEDIVIEVDRSTTLA